MSGPASTIPPGSWVLVTGLTGFIASQVGKAFLERGYKVRGTVRNLQSASWLLEDVFKSYADSHNLELVEVQDLKVDQAFDDAVKGISAVIHVATPIPDDADPEKVIPQTVAGTTSILFSALKEPSLRSFVYTGSFGAAAMQDPRSNIHIDKDSWNEESVKLAYAPPPHTPLQPFFIYMASKVAAEKALWKFVSDHKPAFNVNVVAPSCVFGQPLHKKHSGKEADWAKMLYDGDASLINMQPAGYIIDVKDVALLHVAAALDPDTNNARLHAWGHTQNVSWNDVLYIMRQIRPDREFMSDFEPRMHLNLTTDQSQSIALLKKWGIYGGYRPLKETIEDAVNGIETYADN